MMCHNSACSIGSTEQEEHVSTSKREALLRTPIYPFAEAAHYLQVPATTLRTWCLGKPGSQSIIRLDGNQSAALSFLNLIEAHVLSAIRREQRIPLLYVCEGLRHVSKCLDIDRPLLSREFGTKAVVLFMEAMDSIRGASSCRFAEVAELIRMYLQRIDRDTHGLPMRFYPFTRERADKAIIKSVVMDPRIAFGRAVLVGTAVPIDVVADRFVAGDTLTDLAKDYLARRETIEEALRCELERRKAA